MNASQIVEHHLNSSHFMNADEQLKVARSYMHRLREIKRLKKSLAGCSKRVAAAYEHGVRDGESRSQVHPGFGDMGR